MHVLEDRTTLWVLLLFRYITPGYSTVLTRGKVPTLQITLQESCTKRKHKQKIYNTMQEYKRQAAKNSYDHYFNLEGKEMEINILTIVIGLLWTNVVQSQKNAIVEGRVTEPVSYLHPVAEQSSPSTPSTLPRVNYLPLISFQNCPDGVGLCRFPEGTECTNCYCDYDCELYNDCCVDYVQANNNASTKYNSPKFSCINVRPLLSNTVDGAMDRFIQAVNSCPSSWEDEDIASNCTSNTGLLPPATDLSSNITYKNIFCAVCNEAGDNTTVVWSHEILCKNTALTGATKMCEVTRFVEPQSSTIIHECFASNVTNSCPSFQVASTNFPDLTFEQYTDWVQSCSRYQNLVMAENTTFRNEYCALCNGHLLTEFLKPQTFTSLLVPEEIAGSIFLTQDLVAHIVCDDGFVFVDAQKGCQKIFTFDEEPLNSSSAFGPSCNYSKSLELEMNEFEYAGNNTVLFNGVLLEIELNSSSGQPVVCVNFSQDGTVATYPVVLQIAAYTGYSLSFIGLALAVLSFCLFKELRTLPIKILMNIVITIAAVNLLKILTFSGAATSSSGFCQAVAMLLHLFILAQFVWTTFMAVEMVQIFYMASRLVPVKSEGSQRKFITYTIVCWTVPSILVGASAITNYTSTDLVQYGETSHRCGINHFYSFLVILIFPIGISISIQLISFIAVVILLCQSSRHKAKDDGRKRTHYFRLLLALFFATNITWLLDFPVLITDTPKWAQYPFIILQSLQGFILFLSFFFTKKILKSYTSILSETFKKSTPPREIAL